MKLGTLAKGYDLGLEVVSDASKRREPTGSIRYLNLPST